MPLVRSAVLAATLAALVVFAPRPGPAAAVVPAPLEAAGPTRAAPPELSVMTWNVKGLPIPAAFGRSEALGEIGRRLALMRKEHRQPDVVLLQEAFVPEAKALGLAGGYPYIALGPRSRDAAPTPTRSLPEDFRTDASWSRGEGDGKWADSGLVILSDYPILATRRMAFPADACAGFDCLAAKGVLMARIAVPGAGAPVTVIDTHLNARKASGVAIARADAAYDWQAGAVRRFVAANASADDAVILGGDFNIGHDPARLAATEAGGGLLPESTEAIAATTGLESAGKATLDSDTATVARRAKDKQFFRSGKATGLALGGVSVPFGVEVGGLDLSDHLGFVARYRLAPASAAK